MIGASGGMGVAGWIGHRNAAVDLVIDSTDMSTINGRRPEKTIARLDPTVMVRSLAALARLEPSASGALCDHADARIPG